MSDRSTLTNDRAIIVTCPVCGREHTTYHRIILGKTYQTCENCLSKEEIEIQLKNFKNWANKRYHFN